jgi:hypothetical protein
MMSVLVILDIIDVVGGLLDVTQRHKTASELNAAILTAQCQEKGISIVIIDLS